MSNNIEMSFDNKNIPCVFDDERYENLPSAILKILYRVIIRISTHIREYMPLFFISGNIFS